MTVANICEPAKHLAVLIPAIRGWVSVETSRMTDGIQLLLYQHGIMASIYYLKRNPYLADARNMLTNIFLSSTATDMLFIDDDVGSTPQAVLQIAQAKRAFVAGIYPQKTEDGSVRWPVQFDTPEIQVDDDGFIDNPISVPTGFLRLNRAVFDALDHEDYLNHTAAGPLEMCKGFFKSGPQNGRYVGEDPDLCMRWRALGGKIYIIPDLDFTHSGEFVWRGNFGRWMVSTHEAKSAP